MAVGDGETAGDQMQKLGQALRGLASVSAGETKKYSDAAYKGQLEQLVTTPLSVILYCVILYCVVIFLLVVWASCCFLSDPETFR